MRNLPNLTAWIAGAILCLVSVHLPAQTIFQYPVTAKDVDPGVDHGNSDASLPEQFQKQMVFYRSQHPPGTIIVDTQGRHLYLIKDETHAMRYGIGVGRDGFTWQGLLQISRKAEWPDWHPPPEMIERQPYLPRFMAGGPGNPLGARALYLGNTVYRTHGTTQPSTIGTFVSSGCIRLTNEDITDLYSRVHVGTRVVVLPSKEPSAAPPRQRQPKALTAEKSAVTPAPDGPSQASMPQASPSPTSPAP